MGAPGSSPLGQVVPHVQQQTHGCPLSAKYDIDTIRDLGEVLRRELSYPFGQKDRSMLMTCDALVTESFGNPKPQWRSVCFRGHPPKSGCS